MLEAGLVVELQAAGFMRGGEVHGNIPDWAAKIVMDVVAACHAPLGSTRRSRTLTDTNAKQAACTLRLLGHKDQWRRRLLN
jgi:hypothetical protein